MRVTERSGSFSEDIDESYFLASTRYLMLVSQMLAILFGLSQTCISTKARDVKWSLRSLALQTSRNFQLQWGESRIRRPGSPRDCYGMIYFRELLLNTKPAKSCRKAPRSLNHGFHGSWCLKEGFNHILDNIFSPQSMQTPVR